MSRELLFMAQKLHAALTDASISRKRLDQAWEQINALGGAETCPEDANWNDAINAALDVIERLGGRDPLQKEPEHETW